MDSVIKIDDKDCVARLIEQGRPLANLLRSDLPLRDVLSDTGNTVGVALLVGYWKGSEASV